MTLDRRVTCAVLTFLLAAFLSSCSHSEVRDPGSWNQKTAAVYLDQREVWWIGWPRAARDHGTFCVSCHTAVPYALARPALRAGLGETAPSINETRLLDNVTKRVRLWKELGTFYTDQKEGAHKGEESRGTEAVLNALILASYDAQSGHLSSDTRVAFDNMWAEQLKAGDKKGAWSWLQFDLEPWEAGDSQYYGAAIAALAVGTAPENYRDDPAIQNNLAALREYLDREYEKQSAINRVVLLWASAKMPGMIAPERQKAIIAEVLSQQQSDGGWKLAALAWPRKGWSFSSILGGWIREDGTPMDRKSDGYATGLITFALQQAGMPREDRQVQRGLAWLRRNQNPAEGQWASASLNRRRNPTSDIGRFMSDAATAYAVLALTQGDAR